MSNTILTTILATGAHCLETVAMIALSIIASKDTLATAIFLLRFAILAINHGATFVPAVTDLAVLLNSADILRVMRTQDRVRDRDAAIANRHMRHQHDYDDIASIGWNLEWNDVDWRTEETLEYIHTHPAAAAHKIINKPDIDRTYVTRMMMIETTHFSCPICLEDDIPTTEAAVTNCGHCFCTQCIDAHIDANTHKISTPCALCRTDIRSLIQECRP